MSRVLDVPFGELGDMSTKRPMNLCVERLSHNSTDRRPPANTTNFTQARASGHVFASTAPGASMRTISPQRFADARPMPHVAKDSSFAHWETVPLPANLTLDAVLKRVVQLNESCPTDPQNILLKIKVRFSDASEITFTRHDVMKPKSLKYAGYFSPSNLQKRSVGSAPLTGNGNSVFKSASAAFQKPGSLKIPSKPPLQVPNKDLRNKIFDRMDPNGNGMLSLAELDKAIRELWPGFNKPAAVMRAYKAADVDGTGLITRREFESFLKFLANYNTVFNMFSGADGNNDDRLNQQEFIAAAKHLEPNLTDAECNALFKKVDRNGGGFVLFEEFCAEMAARRPNVLFPHPKVSVKKLAAKLPSVQKRAQPGWSRLKPIRVPEKAEMKKLFERTDPNGNGLMSLAELDKAVLELWPQFNNKPAIMRAYKAADRNGTGFIGKNEFEYFLRYLMHYNNLWAAFADIDTSDDRRITLQEFLAARDRLQVGSELEARQAFQQMDRNHGGFVLFEEFCDWMAKNKAEFEVKFKVSPKTTVKAKSASVSAKPAAVAKPKVYSLPIPSKTETRKLFSRMDPNGNGLLSLAELDKAILELWPEFNNKPAIMRAYKATDKNGNGFVTRDEFEYFLHYLVHYTNLFSQFSNIDTSDDRRITEEEFVSGASRMGLNMPENELVALFHRMDRNDGGYVLFNEFAATMSELKANKDLGRA